MDEDFKEKYLTNILQTYKLNIVPYQVHGIVLCIDMFQQNISMCIFVILLHFWVHYIMMLYNTVKISTELSLGHWLG